MKNYFKIQGLTTDKQMITLEMDEALTQPLQGWIEAIGRPSKANTFQCREVSSVKKIQLEHKKHILNF
jgi:hypothetical protein